MTIFLTKIILTPRIFHKIIIVLDHLPSFVEWVRDRGAPFSKTRFSHYFTPEKMFCDVSFQICQSCVEGENCTLQTESDGTSCQTDTSSFPRSVCPRVRAHMYVCVYMTNLSMLILCVWCRLVLTWVWNVRARARACVRARARACVRACVCVCARARACVCVRMRA